MRKKLLLLLLIILLVVLFDIQFCQAEGYKNPFLDYEISNKLMERELSIKNMKAKVPFKLSGIIESNNNRIAIVSINGETKFIKKAYRSDDFRIVYIGKDRILIRYHGLEAYMEIGGDFIAANK